MILAIVAAGAALIAADPLTVRIAEASAAAEALQGPLDGGWSLVGGEPEAVYALRISDPPGRQGPPEGVWSDTSGHGGPLEITPLAGGRLRLRLSGQPPRLNVMLMRAGPKVWRGAPGSASYRLTHLASP